jgi:hypothetical protein
MDGLQNNVEGLFDNISKSPVMIGIAVLIINLGGRFLANDINRYDEKVLNNKLMKKLTIFSIAFLSTRDIRFSVIIVFFYSILFNPCGLAYKIMSKTQHIMNPFTMLNNLKNVNDIDSLQKKIENPVNKIVIQKIKIN